MYCVSVCATATALYRTQTNGLDTCTPFTQFHSFPNSDWNSKLPMCGIIFLAARKFMCVAREQWKRDRDRERAANKSDDIVYWQINQTDLFSFFLSANACSDQNECDFYFPFFLSLHHSSSIVLSPLFHILITCVCGDGRWGAMRVCSIESSHRIYKNVRRFNCG